MAHNKRCPSLHSKCYPNQNARAFSAAIVAEVRLNISGSARRERGPKSQRWHDSIQTGSVPLASGADQISSARGRGPAVRQGGPTSTEYRGLEPRSAKFVVRSGGLGGDHDHDDRRYADFSDFDDFWALPKSGRVRRIESVQAGVPVGRGAASLIQQRECYQGRRE